MPITPIQFVHGGTDVFAVLVAVAFHHCQSLMSGNTFDGWQANTRLHEVGDGGVAPMSLTT